MRKLQQIIARAQRHGWTVRNYDGTYTYMGRWGKDGRLYGLAITRSTGRVFSK